MNLIKQQRRIAEQHYDARLFVEGMAGTGKTTAGIERVKGLLRAGVPAGSILVLVPQPTLGIQWRTALRRARAAGSASVRVATLSALAGQMIDLYLPLVAHEIGYQNPLEPPHALSLELVQYYMRRYVQPHIEARDLFNSVHASPYRLYTQIIDNLNKAAVVRFSHEEISARLSRAWAGDQQQTLIYQDAQECANLFREVCRTRNLMDFSLQMSIFVDMLWAHPTVARWLRRQYRHLLVDNVEEDTPALHDILRGWLPDCESAVLLYDHEGGHRRFLGADPTEAYRLRELCEVTVTLDRQRIMTPEVAAFQAEFTRTLRGQAAAPASVDVRPAYRMSTDLKYLPQMLDWAAAEVAYLIHEEGVPPSEIVLLAAFLPDALRYMLETRLNALGVPHRALRPSRALRDEPATRTLLTLARLAHLHWRDRETPAITPSELIAALTMALHPLDLVRARLLVTSAYRDNMLHPFDAIAPDVQERITYQLGERYERLRVWLHRYEQDAPLPLDAFLSRLFGEVLSQPGFGFHDHLDAAHITANLIESAREFRQIVGRIEPDIDLPKEYVRSVLEGVLANQYVHPPARRPENAVLISPAHAFLMNNIAVDYQFWLNIGSSGWGQRLYQPLTQPYVLNRQWPPDRVWTDQDEIETDQQELYTLTSGLLRRCRRRVYLGYNQFSEQGTEQRGPLLTAVYHTLRRMGREEAERDTAG